ncbi:MAG: hypothetical protein JEZ06_22735 [Anaerolineaceae bacterium]|nr:hypothetical protein [Anaerolineaceae bacterium]
MPSVRLGSWAVGTAASLVGAGQFAKQSYSPIKKAFNSFKQKTANSALQRQVYVSNNQLMNNPKLVEENLSLRQYQIVQREPHFGRMNYGKAVENNTARIIENNPLLKNAFQHKGGVSQPDFVGTGIFKGTGAFEVTTNNPATISKHLKRTYVKKDLSNLATYSMPTDVVKLFFP